MKIRVEFEGHEMVPPLLWDQCQRAIAAIVHGYGFSPKISTDYSQRMDAETRFFAWVDEQRNKSLNET